MTQNVLAVLVGNCLGIFGVWVLWYVFWRDYRLDSLREGLFGLRGELFDFAVAQRMSFDNPAYTILRNRINFTIRYAHWFSLSRLGLSYLLVRHHDPGAFETSEKKWGDALASVESDAIRAGLNEFRDRLGLTVAAHLISPSFILTLALPLDLCRSLNRRKEQPKKGTRRDIEFHFVQHVAPTLEAHESALLYVDRVSRVFAPAR